MRVQTAEEVVVSDSRRPVLLTCREVADQLQVSVSTVKRMCDQGVLESARTAGGHRRIVLSSVLRYRFGDDLPPALNPETCETDQIVSMLLSSPHELQGLVLSSLQEGVSVTQVLDGVLSQAMRQVGDNWANGSMDVFEEHMCSHNLYCVLSAIRSFIQGRKKTTDAAPLAIGGTAAFEGHSLASMMVELIFEDCGWKTRNMGALLPMQSLISAAGDLKPRIVWVSYTYVSNRERTIVDNQGLVAAMDSTQTLIVGGQGLDCELLSEMSFDFHGATLADLHCYIRKFGKETTTTV